MALTPEQEAFLVALANRGIAEAAIEAARIQAVEDARTTDVLKGELVSTLDQITTASLASFDADPQAAVDTAQTTLQTVSSKIATPVTLTPQIG